ncbi:5-oxoprolinase subunit PxpB [Candidatus Fermentibacteria bacterium]|nr:5-oxoprolinase subunit PxpB [Candidatus Fermentibacteria bacterium]
MSQYPRFLPVGDRALSIELGDSISVVTNRRVHGLSREIGRLGVRGVLDVVPTYRSLMVYYDPRSISYADLTSRLGEMEGSLGDGETVAPKLVEIPALYGGEYGPDIGDVAEHNGVSEAEVIEIHSGADYLVYMMGFLPGFPYLGGMSERIATPRLVTPRASIPTGSVAIAERQTGIYPVESPGGWRIIGRTPIGLFDPGREPPVEIEPGDYLRFVQVDESEYADVQSRIRAGTYSLVTRQMGGAR